MAYLSPKELRMKTIENPKPKPSPTPPEQLHPYKLVEMFEKIIVDYGRFKIGAYFGLSFDKFYVKYLSITPKEAAYLIPMNFFKAFNFNVSFPKDIIVLVGAHLDAISPNAGWENAIETNEVLGFWSIIRSPVGQVIINNPMTKSAGLFILKSDLSQLDLHISEEQARKDLERLVKQGLLKSLYEAEPDENPYNEKVIYRASNDIPGEEEPIDHSCWADEKETAEAYLDNSSYGGSRLFQGTLKGEVLDFIDPPLDTRIEMLKIFARNKRKRYGLEPDEEETEDLIQHPLELVEGSTGRKYPFALWEDCNQVRKYLQNEGYVAIMYEDDFPEGAVVYHILNEDAIIDIRELDTGEVEKPNPLTHQEITELQSQIDAYQYMLENEKDINKREHLQVKIETIKQIIHTYDGKMNELYEMGKWAKHKTNPTPPEEIDKAKKEVHKFTAFEATNVTTGKLEALTKNRKRLTRWGTALYQSPKWTGKMKGYYHPWGDHFPRSVFITDDASHVIGVGRAINKPDGINDLPFYKGGKPVTFDEILKVKVWAKLADTLSMDMPCGVCGTMLHHYDEDRGWICDKCKQPREPKYKIVGGPVLYDAESQILVSIGKLSKSRQ